MIAWLTDNIGTIIAALILIGIVAAVVAKMRKDRKSGNPSCGCGCATCAMKNKCHSRPAPPDARTVQ